jgi:hypothetical protein
MDRYMLMASKLTQLQNLRIGIDYKKMSGQYDRLKKTFLKVPSLEDLIEMLDTDDCYWELWKTKGEKEDRYKGYIKNKIGVGGKTYKIAALKLLAYKRWGLTWSDEKETWEEG